MEKSVVDPCVRDEHLVFRFSLDKKKAEKHTQSINVLLNGKTPEVQKGDTLHVDYDLMIHYRGVATALMAIQQILNDHEVIIDTTTEEVKHGVCLIQDVLLQIKAVQDIIAAR